MSGILNVLLAGGPSIPGDTLIMTTVGTYTDDLPVAILEYGYRTTTRTYGAMNTDVLKDSKTLTDLYWMSVTTDPEGSPETAYSLVVGISGFSSDPGDSYISGVRVDGVDYFQATTASYSSGRSQWIIDAGETDPFETNSVIRIEY